MLIHHESNICFSMLLRDGWFSWIKWMPHFGLTFTTGCLSRCKLFNLNVSSGRNLTHIPGWEISPSDTFHDVLNHQAIIHTSYQLHLSRFLHIQLSKEGLSFARQQIPQVALSTDNKLPAPFIQIFAHSAQQGRLVFWKPPVKHVSMSC